MKKLFNTKLRVRVLGLIAMSIPFSVGAQVQVIEENTTGNRRAVLSSSYTIGQSFRHTNGAGAYEVSRVSARLFRVGGTPEQTLSVALRETWNGPDLASGTVHSTALDNGWRWVDFDVSPVLLNRDQTYFLVFQSTRPNGVYIRFSRRNDYPNGTLVFNGWTLPGIDLSFRVSGQLDPLPEASFVLADSAGTEGESVSVDIDLSFAGSHPVTVNYVVSGGTAVGADYSLVPTGSITLPAGVSSGAVSVSLIDDVDAETDETIEMSITSVQNGNPGTIQTHVLTILDNEPPAPLTLVSGAAAAGPVGNGAEITPSVVGESLDLIYTDASAFGESFSSNWQLAVRGTGPTFVDVGDIGRVAPGSLNSDTLRFYRMARPGEWETSPRSATADVYAYKNVRLHAGQNWVKIWGVPDRNEIGSIFGTGMPAGDSPLTATRISWYDSGVTVAPTNEIWLADGATPEWRWSLGGTGSADVDPIPLADGFVVTLPAGSAAVSCPMIFRVPTSAASQAVAGNKSATLVGHCVPAGLHPRDMNLLASGFTGGPIPPLSDRIWKYNRSLQRVDNTVWYKSTDQTWRFSSAGFPLVPEGYFGADDALFISTQKSPTDWVWINALPYSPPTVEMSP